VELLPGPGAGRGRGPVPGPVRSAGPRCTPRLSSCQRHCARGPEDLLTADREADVVDGDGRPAGLVQVLNGLSPAPGSRPSSATGPACPAPRSTRWARAAPRGSCGSSDAGSPGPRRPWHGRRRARGAPAAGPAREATITQQAVTVLVPERLRLAGDHSHRGRSGPGRARSRSGRAGPVPVAIRSRPSPASLPSPAAPPARACDANPLAGFGSEASKDQHYVLDAAHTQRKG